MGKQRQGFFLSEKENLTDNISANLELNLEFLVQEEQRVEGILTQFFLSEEKREEELDLG